MAFEHVDVPISGYICLDPPAHHSMKVHVDQAKIRAESEMEPACVRSVYQTRDGSATW